MVRRFSTSLALSLALLAAAPATSSPGPCWPPWTCPASPALLLASPALLAVKPLAQIV